MLVVWFQSLGATILFLPALALPSVHLPTEFNLLPFLALFYLGACITFGAQACSAFAVARMPVSRMTAFNTAIPVIGVFFGLILLGERLSFMQWIACGIVLGAVLASQYYQKNKSPASAREPKTEGREATEALPRE